MLSGYKKHKDHESAPPPLTDQELELELVKQQEVRKRISFLLKAVTMYRSKSRTEKKPCEFKLNPWTASSSPFWGHRLHFLECKLLSKNICLSQIFL